MDYVNVYRYCLVKLRQLEDDQKSSETYRTDLTDDFSTDDDGNGFVCMLNRGLMGLTTSLTNKKLIALAMYIMVDVFSKQNAFMTDCIGLGDLKQNFNVFQAIGPYTRLEKLSPDQLEEVWQLFTRVVFSCKIKKIEKLDTLRGKYFTLDDLIKMCDTIDE